MLRKLVIGLFLGTFLNVLSPAATFATKPDEESVLDLKRSAQTDPHPAKQLKPSMESVGVVQTLELLPQALIGEISTFLPPVERMNLMFASKTMIAHMPHLPMWQDLINESDLSDSERKSPYMQNMPNCFIFMHATKSNDMAKFRFAEMLILERLNSRIAIQELGQILFTSDNSFAFCHALNLLLTFERYHHTKTYQEPYKCKTLLEKTLEHASWGLISSKNQMELIFIKVDHLTAQAGIRQQMAKYLSAAMISQGISEPKEAAADLYHRWYLDLDQELLPPNWKIQANFHKARAVVHSIIPPQVISRDAAHLMMQQLAQIQSLDKHLKAEVKYWLDSDTATALTEHTRNKDLDPAIRFHCVQKRVVSNVAPFTRDDFESLREIQQICNKKYDGCYMSDFIDIILVKMRIKGTIGEDLLSISEADEAMYMLYHLQLEGNYLRVEMARKGLNPKFDLQKTHKRACNLLETDDMNSPFHDLLDKRKIDIKLKGFITQLETMIQAQQKTDCETITVPDPGIL